MGDPTPSRCARDAQRPGVAGPGSCVVGSPMRMGSYTYMWRGSVGALEEA